jgi:hypothetical protein
MKPKDEYGKRYGRLVVISSVPIDSKHRASRWQCICDCGRTTVTKGQNLRNGSAVSCGCKRGLPYTDPEDRLALPLWHGAKSRAKAKGITFSLRITDVRVPSHCPVLGIPLATGNSTPLDSSPTLDRINPSGGYTSDNVAVISYRANSIKRNATVLELRLIANYMERHSLGLAQ